MKPRAVIYARCSTEEEAQKDALEKQVQEAKACVCQKGWDLVDIYIESRSGTSTKNRAEYNRLYGDLFKDTFDIIVIKSQDRLMRNTKDWYLFIDRLNTSQKRLYLYLEHNFYTSDDALLTGIKAILAEEYSRELSKKINNAHRNRQKNGGAVILTSRTYGYRKGPDKRVEIVEEEAAVKRRMYELCAAGYGCRSISSILRSEGILNRQKKPFSDADILRMIRNPLNMGTVVMNRFHYDFNTKQVRKNPVEEQYIYKNKVPAIVPEELWERANRSISERRIQKKVNGTQPVFAGKNPGVSMLSGKICCGFCKEPYYRRVRYRYRDREKIYEWKCRTYLEFGRQEEKKARPGMRKVSSESPGGCDNVPIKEVSFMELLGKVCGEYYRMDRESVIKKMIGIAKAALKQNDSGTELEQLRQKQEKIQKRCRVLLEKLLDGVLSDAVYREKQRELEAQLDRVQKKLEERREISAQSDRLTERTADMERQMTQGDLLNQAMTAQMLREAERIYVYPAHMEIMFHPGKKDDWKKTETGQASFPDTIRVEYGHQFDFYKQKQDGRKKILDRMKEKPDITAREIAEDLGLSLSGVQYQIRVLKKEGAVRFEGKGGKGRWNVNGYQENVNKKQSER